ASGTAIA
nr:pep7 peptide [Rotifer birnavirus strain Palavas]